MVHFELIVLRLVATPDLLDLGDRSGFFLKFLVFSVQLFLEFTLLLHCFVQAIAQALDLILQGCCQITGSKQNGKKKTVKREKRKEKHQKHLRNGIALPVPANLRFQFVVFLRELLNAFEMHLLLRVQTLVFFRV